MIICPKCNSWRVSREKGVIKYSRCRSCGWTGIVYTNRRQLSSPSTQHIRLPRRSSWVYVIFILVILGASFLISDAVVAPAKYFAIQNEVFVEKNGTVREIKSKYVMTETPVILAPSTQAAPISTVYPVNAEIVSLQEPEKYPVVANSDSKLYHLPGMKWYNKISSHHRVIFPSEEAAQRAGYLKAPK
jgi:hypothetical protein